MFAGEIDATKINELYAAVPMTEDFAINIRDGDTAGNMQT